MTRTSTDLWPRHRAWIIGCSIALIAAGAGFLVEQAGHSVAPTGSSLVGMILGILAALIIVFELLLTWRKARRGRRWSATSRWMRAHIWLGILCVPLAFLHSGGRFGGWFTSAFMIVLLAVIVSGLIGVWLQWRFRQAQLEEVASETVFAEIDTMMDRYVELAERHLKVICGPEEKDVDGPVFRALRAGLRHPTPVQTTGPARPRTQQEWERLPLISGETRPVPGAEPLRAFFDEEVRGYLLHGENSGSVLHAPHAATQLFGELRARVPAAATETANALEHLCDIRRQLDRQSDLHRRVHGWLLVHIPLAWALVPLLAVHVVTALRYW